MGHDIAVNDVWGNLGVGSAALLTGTLIDTAGWRAVFWVPGLISILIGLEYAWHFSDRFATRNAASAAQSDAPAGAIADQMHHRLNVAPC